MLTFWNAFWSDESGQDLAEYALLIALIAGGGDFVQLAALAEGPLFRIVDAWRELGAVSTAAGVIWRTVVQPLGWVVLPLVLLMWVACATFGAALGRVALGGATQS